MLMQFAPTFDTFAGDAQQAPSRMGLALQTSAARRSTGARGNLLQQVARRVSRSGSPMNSSMAKQLKRPVRCGDVSESSDGSSRSESRKTRSPSRKTSLRLWKRENPALAARGAAGSEPIHSTSRRRSPDEIPGAASSWSRQMPAPDRARKRAANSQQAAPRSCDRKAAGRIAINFGGSLRAEKTTRARTEGEVEPRLIAGHQAAAEAAGVGPDALAARTRREKFHRTGGERGGDGAFAKNQFHLQGRVARIGLTDVRRRNHEFR